MQHVWSNVQLGQDGLNRAHSYVTVMLSSPQFQERPAGRRAFLFYNTEVKLAPINGNSRYGR
jgi:hypothetical protein